MHNESRSKTPAHRPMGGPMGGHMGTGEKARDFKKTWIRLIIYMRSYLPFVITAILFAAAGTSVTIMGPDRIRKITDLVVGGIMTGIDLKAVSGIGFTLTVLFGLSAVISYFQGFIMATVTQKISKKMRSEISGKINRLPLKYFDSVSYGNILSRVTNDVDTIGHMMNQSVGTLVSSVTMFAGSLMMMLITNAVMAFIAVGASLIGFVFMMLIIKNSQKYFIDQQRELGAINGHVEEIYSGHIIVKAFGGEAEAMEKFEAINRKLYESAWKSQFFSGLMMPVMSFIGNFGYVAVCVVGGVMAFNGDITFGVIVAFMVYVRLFTQPLSQIAQAAAGLQSTAAAGERVFEFLSEPELEDESDKTLFLENVKGDVEFRHVRFGYVKDRMIIKDFSAHAYSGQKIAVVGPTGAGKTTLVNLLMRFYETDGGDILIDGIPVNKLTRKNVHRLFCMVLQDTWLFEGTIRENIIFSKKDVTDETVTSACKAVGIDHFIRTLPGGYETVLDEKIAISAGQKQLITIARAVVQNAPLLILDEATSSVDTRTEILIQQAMDKLMAGRTSFIIAHRLSTVRNADLILVMNEGDIVESGKHEDLLAANGFYAELYNSQFEKISS